MSVLIKLTNYLSIIIFGFILGVVSTYIAMDDNLLLFKMTEKYIDCQIERSKLYDVLIDNI